ncbi:tail fiber protein [Acinetobacter phage vB_AbaP_B3]|uniref:Tail fiber protein n=1 Tax=Acinetobacter phage vB_AbaP_B3 TaxID=2016050 RepID=A0A221SBN3_9CAUD|nr:tail fiber protein [Acinetobacter phage vB_AbaP_B3]ASN73401.1 tail fiber protein [Acinetobacter phage vB_AbaP_B3]
MNILRSFTETVVTTPTDTFPISFEYDEKYDAVHVFLNDVAVEDLGYTVSQVNAVTLKVEPAIPEGTVRIERETDIDKMKYIFDAGALFIDQNVDADFKQIVHSQQEVRDGFIKLRGDVLPLVHGLQEALQQAQEASEAAQEAANAAEVAASQTQYYLKYFNPEIVYPKNARIMLDNGDIVRSTIANNTSDPNIDMTGWVKVNSVSQIFDETYNITQSVINGNLVTVDNFGAKGDGVTDDSAAFQAYCDSALTGQNLYLGAKGRYIIKNQVDLKGKGLVGNGCGKVSEFYYNLGCIDVDGSSPDLQGKTAFINCGPTIQNLTARCSNGAGKQVSFIEIDGYLANISYVAIVNFYNQIVVKEALVGFNINNAWLYYSQNAGIYCEDPNNHVSTTGTFHNIYFQLGDGYAMIFDRDIHGCDFDNIIFESMNGGIKARTVAHCGFGKFWCENLKTATSKDWLEVTGANSCYGNSFTGYVKLLGGWTSKTSPTLDSLSTNNYGGVSVSAEGISIVNAGNKAKMLMLPSGFKTGNATIDETHISSSTVTPLVKRRVIGADSSGAQYLAPDTYTKLSRKWGTYNHGSNNAGAFYAPMMLTYDQSFSTPQNNNGWKIVKESTGVYRVERVSGNTSVITNGHIVVGSPLMGSRLGTGAGATHGIQMIETYAGSWTSYTEAAGFKVFWRDSSNALVDPHRFTVAFTATS